MTISRLFLIFGLSTFLGGISLQSSIAQPLEDPAALADKLRRVEQELRDLQYQVNRGVPPSGLAADGLSGGGLPQSTVPQSPVRYDDMEQSLRRLTGQVEEMSFQIKRLQDQYAVFAKDTQYRLSALEGGAPASFPTADVGGTTENGLAGSAPMTLSPTSPGQFVAPSKKAAPGPGTLGTLPASAVPLAAQTASISPNDQYKSALNLLSKQQYSEAQGAFRAFVAANPKHELAGTAQFFAADIDFVQKNYPSAAQGFTSVLRTYPKATRAPDAMLKLGLSMIQAGDKSNGCLALAALKTKYPNANAEVLSRAQKARTQHSCT